MLSFIQELKQTKKKKNSKNDKLIVILKLGIRMNSTLSAHHL